MSGEADPQKLGLWLSYDWAGLRNLTYCWSFRVYIGYAENASLISRVDFLKVAFMWRNIPWIRLLLAGILLSATYLMAGRAVSDRLQFGPAFGSVICLVSACILLGSTLVRQASRPITGIIDRVYFGSYRNDEPPPLNLRLPRAYRAEGCYEKSFGDCERQLEWHSLSPELWAELLLASRAGRHQTGPADAAVRLRALECLGMTDVPERFDKIVRDRDNLPPHPLYLASQFER